MNRGQDRAKRGFTLLELMLGLGVTAVVAGAAGAMLLGAAEVFRSGDSSQAAAMTAERMVVRVASAMASCRRIGAVSTTATGFTVTYWAGDTNADGSPQLSEMAVLKWSVADHSLKVVQQVGLAGGADVVVTKTQMDDATWTTSYLAMNTATAAAVATATGDAKVTALSITVRKRTGVANTVSLAGTVKAGNRAVNFYQTVTTPGSVQY